MSEDTDSDSELEDDFEKDLDELDEDDDSLVVAMNVSKCRKGNLTRLLLSPLH
jgi:hypothetical protein